MEKEKLKKIKKIIIDKSKYRVSPIKHTTQIKLCIEKLSVFGLVAVKISDDSPTVFLLVSDHISQHSIKVYGILAFRHEGPICEVGSF